ncbi:MAG TPA: hypothetical protein VLM89_16150 [Phycisphaerae bacterium]|nr:hypothetical protein [Phycisphaerae bacterium]
MGFTKLCSTIITSSVWSEDHATRIVWISMLAMANAKGHVDTSLPGLARAANVSLEECKAAISVLSSPDQYSRTPDHEGRRIEAQAGGWRILNYQKYRDSRDEEVRKEYQREWDRENRKRKPAAVRHESDSNPTRSDTNPTRSDTIRLDPTVSDNGPTESDNRSVLVSDFVGSDHVRPKTTKAEAEAEDRSREETTPVVVVSSREEPRGDDGLTESPFVSTVAKDVRAECRKVIALWNGFAKQPVRSLPEEMTVESRYAAVRLGVSPNRMSYDQIVGAVENYRLACALPTSQAPKLGLGRFLQPDMLNKYLPGAFTLENYDSLRFSRVQDNGEVHLCAKRAVGGCSGPGVHQHNCEYGPYWFCDAHEAQSRAPKAVPV